MEDMNSPIEVAKRVYMTLYRRAAALYPKVDENRLIDMAVDKLKKIQDAIRFGYNGDSIAFLPCPDNPMARVADFGTFDLYLSKLSVDNYDIPKGEFLPFTSDVRLESHRHLPVGGPDMTEKTEKTLTGEEEEEEHVVRLDPVMNMIEKNLTGEEEEDEAHVVRRHYLIRVPPSRRWDARSAVYRLLYPRRSNSSIILRSWLTTIDPSTPAVIHHYNVDCLDMYYDDTKELCPSACSRFAQFVLVPLPTAESTITELLDTLLSTKKDHHPFRPDVQFIFVTPMTTDDNDPRLNVVTMQPSNTTHDYGMLAPRPPETSIMPDKRWFEYRTLKRVFL